MKTGKNIADVELAAIKRRRESFRAISAVEGIEYTAEDEALFAMFDRERWSHERRLEFLRSRARAKAPRAAE